MAPIDCSVTTGVGATVFNAGVAAGNSVAVIGCYFEAHLAAPRRRAASAMARSVLDLGRAGQARSLSEKPG